MNRRSAIWHKQISKKPPDELRRRRMLGFVGRIGVDSVASVTHRNRKRSDLPVRRLLRRLAGLRNMFTIIQKNIEIWHKKCLVEIRCNKHDIFVKFPSDETAS
jgi:hypothetical protein